MYLKGSVRKLKSVLADPVQYSLAIGESELPLNPCVGKKLNIKFLHIACIYCGAMVKKSYSQGYCFPCSQKLARCDFCIVRPEKCHYHLGTCREPEWGLAHCFIPHIVYLANTSDLKVGITRETQIPTRWIDQGAEQALPIFRVQSRYHSGLVETAFKAFISDRTDWRKMLSGKRDSFDLLAQREQLLNSIDIQGLRDFKDRPLGGKQLEFLEEHPVTIIHYPILNYPTTVKSLNLEKLTELTGVLLGIKGQYLILDVGVINVRSLTGYVVEFSAIN